jgi:hypothetical protein
LVPDTFGMVDHPSQRRWRRGKDHHRPGPTMHSVKSRSEGAERGAIGNSGGDAAGLLALFDNEVTCRHAS